MTTEPQRIRRSRRPGSRLPPNTRCVTRPSKWSNPFEVQKQLVKGRWYVRRDGRVYGAFDSKVKASALAVELFVADWPAIEAQNGGDVTELAGQNLACWCPLLADDGKPYPCHATWLLERANATTTTQPERPTCARR